LSNIRAGTISGVNGTDPVTLTKQSAAKAWVYGSTTASLLGSFNLSSGTDHATGDYSYSLTSSMADLYYSQPVSVVSGTNDRTARRNSSRHSASVVAVETSNARLNTATDQTHNASVHGDLA
jgi:hypothetical protein